MQPRDYQQAAIDAALQWMRTRTESAVLELATGAGKSIIVALLAKVAASRAGNRVLCIAPTKELVQQNHAKYLLTGNPASIFCASIKKSLAQSVVFGSPLTVKNSLDKFGKDFALVIIDECHGITPAIQEIIENLRGKNPALRVLGLSATPYRMNTGYIYRWDENGKALPEDKAKSPYFHKLLYKIGARELIERGFLTPPTTGEHEQHYETGGLALNNLGQFNSEDVERAFEGHGRLTAEIVADIVAQSRNRKGVIIFAATVKHAYEVLASLPPDNSAIIHGGTEKREREKILRDFLAKKIKYLVNVAVLATGVDAPHVDVVALLRATESPSLMQQMIGRGLRLAPNKKDCLVLDYAENIERHCPHGDLFAPEIKTTVGGGDGSAVVVANCPLCGYENDFKARKNEECFGVDDEGYFLGVDGERILYGTSGLEFPAHFGRRCMGEIVRGRTASPCTHRWSYKACFECEHKNDIAARYCEKCKAEIVNPNDKLKRDFIKLKKDPYSLTIDRVLTWEVKKWNGKNGKPSLRIDYRTEFSSFAVWYFPESENAKQQKIWQDLKAATRSKSETVDDFIAEDSRFELFKPATISARKNKESGFFEVFAHNQPEELFNEVS